MAISDTLNSIKTNLENAYTSLENKQATIPANKNIENLASAIDSIQQGGGGDSIYQAQLVDVYVNDDNKLVVNDWNGEFKYDITCWMISQYRLGNLVKLAFQDFYNLGLDGIKEEN